MSFSNDICGFRGYTPKTRTGRGTAGTLSAGPPSRGKHFPYGTPRTVELRYSILAPVFSIIGGGDGQRDAERHLHRIPRCRMRIPWVHTRGLLRDGHYRLRRSHLEMPEAIEGPKVPERFLKTLRWYEASLAASYSGMARMELKISPSIFVMHVTSCVRTHPGHFGPPRRIIAPPRAARTRKPLYSD